MNLAALAADQRHGRDVRGLFDGVIHLRRDAAEIEIAVAFAPERQRKYRNVIDRAGFDQRLRRARRDQIQVGGQLLVQPDDGLLFVLSDQETNDGR